MGNAIDRLFNEWNQLGGSVLLDSYELIAVEREQEQVIAESTSYCRRSGRLTWIMLDWLIRNVDDINEKKLLQEAKKLGDLSVLGLICDIAYTRNSDKKFSEITQNCSKNTKMEIFFHRVAKSAIAEKITRENALDIFKKWNFLCNEIRFL
ncbi:MAG: hypothetical protein K8T10_15610 [Candidatus Eremiobacteraeota bacterium]|nr:hypothetical protein [Candidatus Eremiobacteraeota bacterium]